jgi:hypothetical protein
LTGSSALAVFAFALAAQAQTATTAQTVNASGSSKPLPTTAQAINNQTAVACNLCFTCGGDWPVFAGAITPVGNNPTERGSGCAGSLIVRSDSRPFLCCR